jgi:hypothetical protein
VLTARREGERLALLERARTVLLHAALVEIALGQQPTLFDEPLPHEFSDQAIVGLGRHKYPFAPLLKLASAGNLNASQEIMRHV